MLRKYPVWCARKERLEGMLHESHPSIVHLGSARGFAPGSRVERQAAIAVEVERLSAWIRDCDACLAALNRREHDFVRCHYWDAVSVSALAREWGVSRASLNRLRGAVIAKCAEVLGLAEREGSA